MGHAHGIEWSEKLVCEKIMEVVAFNKSNHMPTHSEMNAYTNGFALSRAVGQYGGTNYFSKLLNLPLKECTYKIGDYYEKKCCDYLNKTLCIKSRLMIPRYAYDILADECVKIDVKISNLKKRNTTLFYQFNLKNKYPTCDIFVCYCVEKNKTQKTYIIPSMVLCGNSQLSIGFDKSKYDNFIDNWDVIKQYSQFYNSFINGGIE